MGLAAATAILLPLSNGLSKYSKPPAGPGESAFRPGRRHARGVRYWGASEHWRYGWIGHADRNHDAEFHADLSLRASGGKREDDLGNRAALRGASERLVRS